MTENKRSITYETINPSYAIPYAAFETPVAHPIKYRYPNKIDRENFTSAVIIGFRRSRGSQVAHWAWYSWLEHNTGFDFTTTFNNFYHAYLHNVLLLSQTEKDFLTTAYQKVPLDQHKPHPDVFPSIVDELSHLASRQNQIEHADKLPVSVFQDLPLKEFGKRIDAYLKTKR